MMKRIVEINTTNYASTGNIMLNIAKLARNKGYDVYTCCKASKESFKYQYDNQIYIGYRSERILSSFLASLTGLRDHFNILGTLKFIKELKKIKPDLIHLHVLHDDFINIKLLFKYLSSLNIPVIWTLHDCNPITGKCPGFEIVNCDKWKTGCYECPQLKAHPCSKIDVTNYIWATKKKFFNLVKYLTIVSPSIWLSNIVKESYLKNHESIVINNGVDLEAYKNIPSNFKEKHNLNNKFVVLGVANVWNKAKGIDTFIKLAEMLTDEYQIVLVGTNDEIDKLLPKNILSIHRTYNKKELVEIYSASDVFVNPTRQEVFGMVNVEALACGTPVITYNTGGSVETIDEKCGFVVEKDNVDLLKEQIINVCQNKPFNQQDCINRAKQFDMNIIFEKYINLYDQKLNH